MPSVSESLGTSRFSSCAISFPPPDERPLEKKGSVISHKCVTWLTCQLWGPNIAVSGKDVGQLITASVFTRQMLSSNIIYGLQEPWSGNIYFEDRAVCLAERKSSSLQLLCESMWGQTVLPASSILGQRFSVKSIDQQMDESIFYIRLV